MSSLAEFSRSPHAAPVPLSSRVAAAALTAGLYALLLFLGGHRASLPRPPSEVVASLLPVVQEKKPLPQLPEFVAHLIRPRAEAVAPPSFTVESETPPPPASLSPSTATSSPLASLSTEGGPAGTGARPGGIANGVIGNGNSLSACYEAAWAQAVTDRIKKFFFYPKVAYDRKITGEVFMHMRIRSNGRLSYLKVNKSSGVRVLDDAAYTMVRKAVPLPRIPAAMHIDRIDVELPIIFGTRDENLHPRTGDCGHDVNVITHRDT
jgi:TonB family protein